MLTALGLALGLLLVLLIALTAIRVELQFHKSWPRRPESFVRIRWAFGLVRAQISPRRSKERPAKGEAAAARKAAPPRKRPRKKRNRKKRNVLKALRQAGVRRRLIRFLEDLWRAIHKDDLHLRVRLGLGDPADTGRLWALVGPISALLRTLPGTSVVIEPEFSDSACEANAAGNVRVVPLKVIALIVSLLLSPAIWRGFRAMRAAS
jgi:hypothetical protein